MGKLNARRCLNAEHDETHTSACPVLNTGAQTRIITHLHAQASMPLTQTNIDSTHLRVQSSNGAQQVAGERVPELPPGERGRGVGGGDVQGGGTEGSGAHHIAQLHRCGGDGQHAAVLAAGEGWDRQVAVQHSQGGAVLRESVWVAIDWMLGGVT